MCRAGGSAAARDSLAANIRAAQGRQWLDRASPLVRPASFCLGDIVQNRGHTDWYMYTKNGMSFPLGLRSFELHDLNGCVSIPAAMSNWALTAPTRRSASGVPDWKSEHLRASLRLARPILPPHLPRVGSVGQSWPDLKFSKRAFGQREATKVHFRQQLTVSFALSIHATQRQQFAARYHTLM